MAAEASSSSSSKLTLKLLVDKKARRVLFAEAEKDFVDFLLTLLSIPLGSVIRLLSTDKMVGSLGNLYQSIEDLSNRYIQDNINKDTVLKPKAPCPFRSTLLLSDDKSDYGTVAPARKVYTCPKHRLNVTYDPQRNCYECCGRMNCEVVFVDNKPAAPSFLFDNKPAAPSFLFDNKPAAPSFLFDSKPAAPSFLFDSKPAAPSFLFDNKPAAPSFPFDNKPAAPSTEQKNSGGEGGFVKGVVTYMVMDNLEVKPMSTISSIALLNKFNITDLGSLEEKVVEIGMDQGLNLLKASLESKTVLTRVFLGA